MSFDYRDIDTYLLFLYRSDEETSGDEAEDHEIDEENAEDGEEDKPLEASKAAQIQKL